MNLQKLFTAQAELDAFIEQQHPTQPGENRLEKKVLALLVELGECANEFRGFKFWSNDQEPRNYCKSCVMTEMPHECENLLLEEYVDCLHFILSIGNDLVVTCDVVDFEDKQGRRVTDIFNHLFQKSVHMEYFGLFGDKDTEFKEIFSLFLTLGYKLGFTEEQIEEAYWKKYEINKQRQRDGY